jgi:hypothetical protein
VTTTVLVFGSAAAALVAMSAPAPAGLLVATALLGFLPAGPAAPVPGGDRQVRPASG